MVATTPVEWNPALDSQMYAVGRHTVLLQTDVICYGPVVAIEAMQVALNPYQAFQTQSICN